MAIDYEKRKKTNKKILKIFGIICLVIFGIPFLISLFMPSSSQVENQGLKLDEKSKANVIELKEELPEPNKCSSNLGILKSNPNSGESIGKRTEKTELKKLLDEGCDIIEITYTLKPSNPAYSNTAKKLVYNKIERTLNDIYTKNNVIDEYKNVTTKALLDVINKGESLYAIEESEYNFNNNKMTVHAVGKRPKQSEWDGSVKVVKDYIESNANDASSIEYLEWSKVTDSGEFWIVRCKYKGSNAFGGIVTQNAWFYMQNESVVDAKLIIQ